MRTRQEIEELTLWLTDDYHKGRTKCQEDEDKYYRDTFEVPNVNEPYQRIQLGTGARAIDTPVAHIITTHPKVYVEAVDNNQTALERARKRGTLYNHWASKLAMQNPQPFRLFSKFLIARGEGWMRVVNNPNIEEADYMDELPFILSVLDPLIVFGSPDEKDGIPEYVVVKFKRDYSIVQNRWPYWENPNRNGENKQSERETEWVEYWDKDCRLFKADGEPVTGRDDKGKRYGDGVESNILKRVPFIHEYSGYGLPSADGKPENLAVGRLRYNQGLMLEQTEIRSYIASQIKLHSVGRVRMESISDEYNDLADKIEYDLSAGAKNLIPFGVKVTEEMGAEPGSAIFSHMLQIERDIAQTIPPIMSGIGTGTSGRQEDIYSKHAIAQYQTIIDTAGLASAKALEAAARICYDLNLFPLTVRGFKLEKGQRIREFAKVEKDDMDDFECEVQLKASDPIEDKAQATLGDDMQLQGIIDHETNLTKYHGYSLDEARDVIDRVWVDNAMKASPIFMQAIAMEAAKRLGIPIPPTAMAQPGQGPVPGQPGAEGGPPRTLNVQSARMMAEQPDVLLGNRSRPRRSPGTSYGGRP